MAFSIIQLDCISAVIRHILPERSRGVRMSSTWWSSDLHVGHHMDWIHFTSAGGSSWKGFTHCRRHRTYIHLLITRGLSHQQGVWHDSLENLSASLPQTIQPESSNFVRQRRIFHLPHATFEPDAFSRRAAYPFDPRCL